jgi:hypothetical protein
MPSSVQVMAISQVVDWIIIVFITILIKYGFQ